ncbi:MAG: extracellular solute-binding protein [Spirochaetaceae bacterium]|nr:extracellular solute-binding protein [Spirochaetaceae bacterium]
MKKLLVALLILASITTTFVGCKKAETASGPVTISFWTKEGEAENALQFVEKLAADFSAANENITIEVLSKHPDTLRPDFQTAALAGTAPDLLWTVSDHAGPFITAGLIQPVDKFADMSKYVGSVVMNGETWAVPISSGNHLMLMVNKKFVSTFPQNTDDFIAAAKAATKGENYGLVYNLGEAFWLAPWLGGFGGSVFAEDGVTPTLDTPAMINTLKFLQDLKFTHKVTPTEADYAVADSLFKEGKAAMLINGDWSIGGYKDALGDDLMIGRIPKVSSTGKYPAPYTAGAYFMVPADLPAEKEAAVKAFIAYVTSEEKQSEQLEQLSRLPGLKAALANPSITSDPLLKGSVEQMEVGTPQPTVLEMRAIWDAINPELSAVMAGSTTPEEAAKKMQTAAVNGIANQK